jgi:hypothetical protein
VQNVTDPLEIGVMENETDHRVSVEDLFTDSDIPEDYAGDSLTFSVSGMKQLDACILPAGILSIDSSKWECRPGYPGRENLLVTAKDRAGRTVCLNISVTILPVNDPPQISAFQPAGDYLTVKEMVKRTFSVTVIDPDTDISGLGFAWYLDGVRNLSIRDWSFAFIPDYSMGGCEHRIKVEVSDDNYTISREWVVTVTDVNRLPEGAITSPLNFTKFVKGAIITFRSNGSDPDGDKLAFIWRDGDGAVIGEGPSFTYDKFNKGYQTIMLEINDTNGSTYREVTITIIEQGQKRSGGFEACWSGIAIGLSLLFISMKKRGH